jgi:hypothetical protein
MELLRAFVPGVSVKKQLLIQTFVSNFDDGHSLTYSYNNSGAISDADTTMAKNANAASTTCHAPHCASLCLGLKLAQLLGQPCEFYASGR